MKNLRVIFWGLCWAPLSLTLWAFTPLSLAAAKISPLEKPLPKIESTALPTGLNEAGMLISEPQSTSPLLPGKFLARPHEIYYFYRQRLSLQLGLAFDSEHTSQENFTWSGSLAYDFPRAYSPHLQLGFEYYSSNKVIFHLSQSRTFREHQAYRPHLALGIAHRPKPEQQLIGFANFDNYLLRATLGFEDRLKTSTSFRMDLSLAIGPSEFLAHLGFGYSWAW